MLAGYGQNVFEDGAPLPLSPTMTSCFQQKLQREALVDVISADGV